MLSNKKVKYTLQSLNTSDTESFLDLHLTISNDTVSSKIYEKRDDFDFEMINFPYLDGDGPHSKSYGVHPIFRASSNVADFNTRN